PPDLIGEGSAVGFAGAPGDAGKTGGCQVVIPCCGECGQVFLDTLEHSYRVGRQVGERRLQFGPGFVDHLPVYRQGGGAQLAGVGEGVLVQAAEPAVRVDQRIAAVVALDDPVLAGHDAGPADRRPEAGVVDGNLGQEATVA